MSRPYTGYDEAQNPDADPRMLAVLAKDYPNEVLANPLLPLVMLEDAALYALIRGVAEVARDPELRRYFVELAGAYRRGNYLTLKRAYELSLAPFQEPTERDVALAEAQLGVLLALGLIAKKGPGRPTLEITALGQEAEQILH